jgi:hypothetical protein
VIAGTSYSPAKAFITFAREFFEALAREDYQAALGGLDSTERRWSKQELLSQLGAVIGEARVCSPAGFEQSATPQVERTDLGYRLRHRLPVQGKWVRAVAVFEFVQKADTDYYRVNLHGFEP